MSDKTLIKNALTRAIEALEGCERPSERRARRGKGLFASIAIAEVLGKLREARERL